MPAVSEEQRRAMWAAKNGKSNLGIPRSVGEKFVGDANARLAAGVVFVAPDGDVLLLRRAADEKNYGGHWGLPGGGGEEGEGPLDAAIRECKEEMGVDVDPAGCKAMDARETPNGFNFHTFTKAVNDKFVPTLDHEHSGFCWASLDMLPKPLHPSVEGLLGANLGAAADMLPEQWGELRTNFAQWTREEEDEEEHQGEDSVRRAHDSLILAMDESVRSYDTDGRLRVVKANISKANVCPYWGHEIPDFERLGLDPERQYQLLRDPKELKKAAKSSNGVPLLFGHTPVSPDEHPHDVVVGAVGTDAEFDGQYLTNSLIVWTREGIDGVESEEQKELSSGYRYDPVMTPGQFHGAHYDGVMTNIVFNHVALVPEGRAGADVVVGDSQIKPKSQPMEDTLSKHVLTRFAGASMVALDMAIRPRLTKDAKIDLAPFFKDVTKKNFASLKGKIAQDIKAAVRGKMAKDANLDDMHDFMDRLDKQDLAEGADEDPNSGLPMSAEDMEKAAKDAAKDKKAADRKAAMDSFRDKLDGEDMKKAFDEVMGEVDGEDGEVEEAEENAEGKDAKEDDDKGAKDGDLGVRGKDGKGMDKKAMDAAIRSATEETAKRIKREMRETAQAYADVEPFVGKLALGMDSAADVYRTALKGIGMDAKKVDAMHADALKPILEAQPKAGETRSVRRAEDSAITNSGGFSDRWGKQADRIGGA